MRKFIRFFVCFFLIFSLFTQNVYAASVSSFSVKLLPFNALSSSFYLYPFFGSSPSNSNSSGQDHYVASAFYSGSDSIYFQALDSSTNMPIEPGYYSISARCTYTLTVTSTSDLPSYPTPPFTCSFSFGNVPDGLVFSNFYDSYKKIDNNTFEFTSHFFVSGTFNFRPYGNASGSVLTSSIPVDFDLFFYGSFPTLGGGISTSAVKFPHLNCTSSFSCNPDVVTASLVSSFDSTDGILSDIDQTIKDQHQQDIDEANKAGDTASSSSDELVNTLSAWEIFIMPFQLLKDFASAIAGDGSTTFTFPSFTLMGYQIWPSYSFDLSTIQTNFPLLYNGVHAISGIFVVNGFIHYCWRKWAILMGDDMPESGGDG